MRFVLVKSLKMLIAFEKLCNFSVFLKTTVKILFLFCFYLTGFFPGLTAHPLNFTPSKNFLQAPISPAV